MVSGRQRCCPESKRECEGVDPNRARGTQPTPRLYCSEGSPSALQGWWRRVAGCDRPIETAERKSHWGGSTISRGRTPLFLRIVRSFVLSQTLGRRGEPDGLFVRPRPASQETCHPRAWCPHWGGLPVASTEVVVATSCIRGSWSTRRCRSVFSGLASTDYPCTHHACTAGSSRAVEGHGAP